jgi:hypothetical protein
MRLNFYLLAPAALQYFPLTVEDLYFARTPAPPVANHICGCRQALS